MYYCPRHYTHSPHHPHHTPFPCGCPTHDWTTTPTTINPDHSETRADAARALTLKAVLASYHTTSPRLRELLARATRLLAEWDPLADRPPVLPEALRAKRMPEVDAVHDVRIAAYHMGRRFVTLAGVCGHLEDLLAPNRASANEDSS